MIAALKRCATQNQWQKGLQSVSREQEAKS
jgi:hypothetical protein